MSKKDTTLVILAAGLGSRYGGLKQLDSVGPNGEVILDYSVYDAIETGFTKIVFVIRKDFERQFTEKVVNKYKDKIEIKLAFQDMNNLPEGFYSPIGREKPWGTAHALLCTRNVVDEPFAVINADDFYGRSAFQTLHEYMISDKMKGNKKADVCNFAMVGFKLNNTLSDHGSVARGICWTDDNNKLTGIKEYLNIQKTAVGAENVDADGNVKEFTGEELTSMNMWCFTPEIFDVLENKFVMWLENNVDIPKSEFLIPTEIDYLIRDNVCTIDVLETDSKWFGVTYKADKPVVMTSIKKLVNEGIYN